MNIILVGKRSSFPYATGNFFHKALTKLGHTIVDVGIDKHPYLLPRLSHVQQSCNADLLIVLKGHGIQPEWITSVRCPTVLWYQDDAFEWETARDDLLCSGAAYDHVFYFDHAQLEFVKSLGIPNVKFLPCATDPAVYKYIPNTPKVHDISFVGNVSAPRRKILDRIARRFNINVQTVFLDQMVKTFNQTKINFNLSVGKTGFPLRIFEALGMCSFLLTSHVPEEYRLFTDGVHLAYYTDDNLEEQIRYYLDNPELRERIANQGYKEILQKHTFDHRMRQLLKEVT